MPTTVPQEIIDALVRADAIQKECHRLNKEAQALRDSDSLANLIRLGVIEKRCKELLAEMRQIDRDARKFFPPAKRPRTRRARLFSWLGLGKATGMIVWTVACFLTNPFVVLIVVLALMYDRFGVA